METSNSADEKGKPEVKVASDHVATKIVDSVTPADGKDYPYHHEFDSDHSAKQLML